MKKKLKEYRQKLEKSIAEYMALPVSERSAAAVGGMVDCWEHIHEMEECLDREADFSREDAVKWVSMMENADGTTGAHWSMEQTNAVAEAIGITVDKVLPYIWWAALNMMYSDYCTTAVKYGVSSAEFYADLASDFLFDKDADGARKKTAAYYHAIANPDGDCE